jgi:hypothetical protein
VCYSLGMKNTTAPDRKLGANVISSDPTRTPGHVVKIENRTVTVRWCYGLETDFHGWEFESFCERN